jgi:hypothetical protein
VTLFHGIDFLLLFFPLSEPHTGQARVSERGVEKGKLNRKNFLVVSVMSTRKAKTEETAFALFT